jgi:hypothetical protein
VKVAESDLRIAWASKYHLTTLFFWSLFGGCNLLCALYTIPYLQSSILGICWALLAFITGLSYLQAWLKNPGYIESKNHQHIHEGKSAWAKFWDPLPNSPSHDDGSSTSPPLFFLSFYF